METKEARGMGSEGDREWSWHARWHWQAGETDAKGNLRGGLAETWTEMQRFCGQRQGSPYTTMISDLRMDWIKASIERSKLVPVDATFFRNYSESLFPRTNEIMNLFWMVQRYASSTTPFLPRPQLKLSGTGTWKECLF